MVATMNAKFPGSVILRVLHVHVDCVHPSFLRSSSLSLSLYLHHKHLFPHIFFISPFYMSIPPQPAFSCLYREFLLYSESYYFSLGLSSSILVTT